MLDANYLALISFE